LYLTNDRPEDDRYMAETRCHVTNIIKINNFILMFF